MNFGNFFGNITRAEARGEISLLRVSVIIPKTPMGSLPTKDNAKFIDKVAGDWKQLHQRSQLRLRVMSNIRSRVPKQG